MKTVAHLLSTGLQLDLVEALGRVLQPLKI